MFWGTVLAATVINKVSTFGKVINRVAKSQISVTNRGFGKCAAQPHPPFLGVPPGLLAYNMTTF